MAWKRRVGAVFAVVAVLGGAGVGASASVDKDKREGEVVARVVEGEPPSGAVKVELVPDTGADRATGEVGVQAAFLPFNFNFDFTVSLASRTFWPVLGRACVSLRGTGSADPSYYQREVKVEMWDAYGTDTKKGLTARYSLNGGYYGYCWSGLSSGHEHYFRIYKDWNLGARVWGNGWTSPV